jgi:hypothetical protein
MAGCRVPCLPVPDGRSRRAGLRNTSDAPF